MSIIEQLVQKKFIATQGLSDWEEQQLQMAAREGTAVRIRNGIYASVDALADTMIDISLIVPGGILCLWSAWAVHGLTTQIPNAYYVAIERSRKVTVPQDPEFKLVYQSSQFLSIGVIHQLIQGYDITLFDVERCVCDAVRYRKKVGMDVMAEILQTYLKRPGINLSKLINYAAQLRISSTLKTYLEAWQ